MSTEPRLQTLVRQLGLENSSYTGVVETYFTHCRLRVSTAINCTPFPRIQAYNYWYRGYGGFVCIRQNKYVVLILSIGCLTIGKQRALRRDIWYILSVDSVIVYSCV